MLIYENEGDSTTTSSLAQCAVIRYVRDGQTDRQRDGQKQRLLPLPYGRGCNNRKSCIASYARNWTQAMRKLAVKYRHRTNCPKRNFFAAIRGSVRVRTPPRGSDRVRSTGWCQFSKKIPAKFCPTATKVGLRPRGSCPGGGRGGLPPKVKYTSRVMVAVSILSVKRWRDLEMWVVTERVNVIIMFVGINSN